MQSDSEVVYNYARCGERIYGQGSKQPFLRNSPC